MRRTLFPLLTTISLSTPALASSEAPPAAVAPLPPLPPLPPASESAAPTSAELTVKGPVTVRAAVVATDLEVVPGAATKVKAQLTGESRGVRLIERGDRIDVDLQKSSWPFQQSGRLRLELPPGCRVELSSTSGDISVRDLGSDLRIRTTSGDVHITKANAVEVMSVSGDVLVESASGEVRLRTVSGDAKVAQARGATKLEFGSTSGDLDWSGGCGAGCRIEVRTMSGDAQLRFDGTPSFDLSFASHSGDLRDRLKLGPGGGENARGRVGKGEGMVEVQTFSGDLTIQK